MQYIRIPLYLLVSDLSELVCFTALQYKTILRGREEGGDREYQQERGLMQENSRCKDEIYNQVKQCESEVKDKCSKNIQEM